ncbi:hypothetical protein ACFL2B_02535 [Patescibacteria group bacterium]
MIAFIGGVLIVAGCQSKDKVEIPEVTPNADANQVEVVKSPVATPTTTTVDVELEDQVFTNKNFGYQVTLPPGYGVELTTVSQPLRDSAVLKDEAGEEFAFISTPPPEVGWELWDFENATESEIEIPDSDQVLYVKKASPLPDADIEESIIMVSWGLEFGEDVSDNEDLEKSGIIYTKFLPDEKVKEKLFDSLIETFRFSG